MKRETNDDVRVDELIRAAGRRPPILAGDLAALRESADVHWRRMVAAERRRNRQRRAAYAIAASLTIALFGAWWWFDRTVSEGTAPVAVAVMDTGGSLFPGERLRVADSIAFRMVGGPSVRLRAGTSLRLVAATKIELERGAVYVDSGRDGSGGVPLVILTAAGAVHEVGTQYEVRSLADEVAVRVREGRVAIDRDGAIEYAGPGESLIARRDGTITRSTITRYGPEWAWVLAIAPALDVEGSTLASYLGWIERETGWRVRYADDALASAAQTIRLHGTIKGLRPDESLDVVLPGARLGHQVDGETLRVFRIEN